MVGESFSVLSSPMMTNAETYAERCMKYGYLNFYGIFCPIKNGGVNNGLNQFLQLSGFNYPSVNGVNVPTGSYGGFSLNTG